MRVSMLAWRWGLSVNNSCLPVWVMMMIYNTPFNVKLMTTLQIMVCTRMLRKEPARIKKVSHIILVELIHTVNWSCNFNNTHIGIGWFFFLRCLNICTISKSSFSGCNTKDSLPKKSFRRMLWKKNVKFVKI